MVPWFTSGFQIRQGMQQNTIPVPTSKLSFKVQFFAETYFRVFKSFAKIAKIRFSRKFLVIRYPYCRGIWIGNASNNELLLMTRALLFLASQKCSFARAGFTPHRVAYLRWSIFMTSDDRIYITVNVADVMTAWHHFAVDARIYSCKLFVVIYKKESANFICHLQHTPNCQCHVIALALGLSQSSFALYFKKTYRETNW